MTELHTLANSDEKESGVEKLGLVQQRKGTRQEKIVLFS